MLLVFAAASLAMAADHDLKVDWADLAPLVAGKEIDLVLPDATHIRGTATAVHGDALLLDIRKTSSKKTHPKGTAEIPRASVSVIELRQHGSNWGGHLARTTGGFFLGLLLGEGIGLATRSDAGVVAGGLIGMATGTVIGWESGNPKITTIRILPSTPVN